MCIVRSGSVVILEGCELDCRPSSNNWLEVHCLFRSFQFCNTRICSEILLQFISMKRFPLFFIELDILDLHQCFLILMLRYFVYYYKIS